MSRNLIEYPITLEEAQQALSSASDAFTSQGIYFGTQPYIYACLGRWISDHPELISDIFGVESWK